MKIRIGTRGSALALAQAGAVADGLRERGAETELMTILTEGDRRKDRGLADIGGKGLFVRDIEKALLAGAIDVAVHSLKDLPADLPAGLVLAAFPAREDPRDVLVTRERCAGLRALPAGSVVATGSLRRRALLLAARPDLVIQPVRGNVDTRLRKLHAGEWATLVLAAAGLARLGVRPPHVAPLEPDEFVPAVGQGLLAIEIRADDGRLRSLLEDLDDPASRACALAERAYLRRLGASCRTPVGGHAVCEAATLRMAGVVASEDGRRLLRDRLTGSLADAAEIGRALAASLLTRGAADLTPLGSGAGRGHGGFAAGDGSETETFATDDGRETERPEAEAGPEITGASPWFGTVSRRRGEDAVP
jgi:hydroxymethylbilane synthase